MISTTYIQQYKIILSTFLITILLIFPKINIFDINNYWQGIRFENLISLFLLILIISSPKKFKINDGYKFYLFFSFIFLSYSVGFISNLSPNIIVLIRIIEYAVFIIYFTNTKLDYKKLILIFKVIILINFVFSLLQYFDLVGFISSRGYYAPNYAYSASAGIFSGSWESSFITSVLYFIIYLNDKKKINLYLFLTLIILFLADTRGVLFPFFLSIFFLYKDKFKINISHLIILLLASYGFYFFILKYYALDIFVLFESFVKLIIFNQNMFADLTNLSNEYYSWAYRLVEWSRDATTFNTNIFTILFGTGYLKIYYESFLIRILFANGIIGLLVLFILSLRIKFYMIIFLLLSGITLDYVASFKMFIVLFLYFKFVKLSGK